MLSASVLDFILFLKILKLIISVLNDAISCLNCTFSLCVVCLGDLENITKIITHNSTTLPGMELPLCQLKSGGMLVFVISDLYAAIIILGLFGNGRQSTPFGFSTW